ncbi:HNH endonuclease [Halosimplex marinum]|uniref:HNH endonuclease n=1 Tax=Halosimplex marinum TaxID=3396620 RepID=UPI003F57980A
MTAGDGTADRESADGARDGDRFDEERVLSLRYVRDDRDDRYEEHGIDRRLDDPDRSDDRTPDDWQTRREAIADYYDGECGRCGSSLEAGWHCHHVRPLKENGTHALENLVALCEPCHTLLHPYMDDADWADAPMFPAADADPRVAVERRPVSAPEDEWFLHESLGGEQSLGGQYNYQSRSAGTTTVPAVAAVQKTDPEPAELEEVEDRLSADVLTDPGMRARPYPISNGKATESDQRSAWRRKRRAAARRYRRDLDAGAGGSEGGTDDGATGSSSGTADTDTDAGGSDADEAWLLVALEGKMGVGAFVGAFLALTVGYVAGSALMGISEPAGGALMGIGICLGGLVVLFAVWTVGHDAAFHPEGPDGKARYAVGPWSLATVPVAALALSSYPPGRSLGVVVAWFALVGRLSAVVGADWRRYVRPRYGDGSDGLVGPALVAGVVLLAAVPGVLATLAPRVSALAWTVRPIDGLAVAVLSPVEPILSALWIDFGLLVALPSLSWPLALAVGYGAVSSAVMLGSRVTAALSPSDPGGE